MIIEPQTTAFIVYSKPESLTLASRIMPILIQSTDPQDIIRLFVGDPQQDNHARDYRWHVAMMNINPNYQGEIARRQAYKRSIGK